MARGLANGERDGNLHIHKSIRWVDGTYHDGQHPVKRKHQGVTEEGRELHTRHMEEIRIEASAKERAVTTPYATECDRCKKLMPQGIKAWRLGDRGVRHRDDGTCDIDPKGPYSEPQTSPKAASKADLAKFEEAIRLIKEQSDAEVAALVLRIELAESTSKEAEAAVARAEKTINTTRRLEVVREVGGKKKVKKLKAQHVNFERLLTYVQAGINTVMVGDAGSGKTVAGSALASALGLDFYHIPLGPQTSKSDLLGYMNGVGKYVYSLLCRVYENGGVALLDEMDASNPATLTIINGMLEAMEAGFADKMRKRHPDCVFVAAMNTFGRGADMLFVGRAQLDAATLNRWAYLTWDTDWDLTRRIVKNDEWVKYIKSLYDSAARQKVRVTIGMRTALMGQKLLKAGIPRDEVEQVMIWAPIKPDDKQKILAGVKHEKEDPKEEASWS